MKEVKRHHWLNTIVGIIDSAFRLSPMEQIGTLDIVNKLLKKVNIPERSVASDLPAPVSFEIASGIFSNQLASARNITSNPDSLPVSEGDMVISAEAWRDALAGLLFTSYPDLDARERLIINIGFTDLLDSLGIPARKAFFFPQTVITAYRNSPEGVGELLRPSLHK
jgi:hypothetical protein